MGRSKADYGNILARKYYDKLYKEYVVVDISQVDQGKVGCRWRTKQEVLLGKGDIICGNKKCTNERALEDYEFVFRYREQEREKKAFVKVKLCSTCEPIMRKSVGFI